MSDRIKLAEAMKLDAHPKGFELYEDGDERKYPGFEPFRDANDDYAVLEWMREHKDWREFRAYLIVEPIDDGFNYKIGDYARAALKVIDDE